VAQSVVRRGRSLQEEGRLLEEAGIGAEDVWKLAPREAGDRLGVGGLGRIETGAPADILLFRRDPTTTLDNLASLEAVIAAGKLYRITDLANAQQQHADYFNSTIIMPLARPTAHHAPPRPPAPAADNGYL